MATTFSAPLHMVPYDKAMQHIEDHGHRAFLTHDGLLALSGGVWSSGPGASEGDTLFDEPCVFEVTSGGMVSSRAVRLWLGY